MKEYASVRLRTKADEAGRVVIYVDTASNVALMKRDRAKEVAGETDRASAFLM